MSDRTVEAIAVETGGWHQLNKESEAELKKIRKEFFDAITAEAKETPARKVYLIEDKRLSLVEAEERALKYNPGWRNSAARETTEAWELVLEEDPAFIGRTIVTTPTEDDPGYVVTKTIRSGTTMIDLDRMKVEDIKLYLAVTEYPSWATAAMAYMDDGQWDLWIDTLKVERQPKPSEQLTPEQLESVKPYIYEAPKTVALNVRLAKEEDYEAT